MAEVEIKQENLVYAKPRLITDNVMHYCPGCSHGTVHKLVAEVIDEMGLAEHSVGISPVGCAVFAYNYIDIDWIEAAHGRALAVATAVKRLNPGNLVFTYQGDGDLSAIGTAESIHAAARGENVVAIYINNAIYGMTGGQMAPTTLLGMKTATTPYGRDPRLNGYPYKIAEMMAHLDGATYITRQSVHTPANVRKCKKAIRKAFENSMAGNGFSLVEVVATCNSGWKSWENRRCRPSTCRCCSKLPRRLRLLQSPRYSCPRPIPHRCASVWRAIRRSPFTMRIIWSCLSSWAHSWWNFLRCTTRSCPMIWTACCSAAAIPSCMPTPSAKTAR